MRCISTELLVIRLNSTTEIYKYNFKMDFFSIYEQEVVRQLVY